MTEKLQQTIKEEIMELPKEAQEAIGAFDWVKITEEIGKKYLLEEDEINNLQLETLLALTNITDIRFFTINIENQVETTKETAENISREISQKIFNPINNLLIENIKKNLENKKLSWQQNLDFIVSGGNYSVFLEEGIPKNTTDETPKINTLDNSSKIADIKSKFTI